jgi:hypothetical protein
VNTVDGWREMRLSVVARREAGTPALPSGWDQRVLPEPTARLAVCAIADCHHVGASWKRLSRRLHLEEAEDLSVIADGAKWIWDQARRRLPGTRTQWCVDVYHVSEHLHACGKALHGEGSTARNWAQERLQTALESNGVGLTRRLERERSNLTGGRQKAVDQLLGYLKENRDSLWYQQRLAEGKAIGSGLIEGCCKTAIGGRLKLNSARWRVRRAERMGALRCMDYSGLTQSYWQNRAA